MQLLRYSERCYLWQLTFGPISTICTVPSIYLLTPVLPPCRPLAPLQLDVKTGRISGDEARQLRVLAAEVAAELRQASKRAVSPMLHA